MPATLRPTVASDLVGLIDEPLPHRIQAVTMELDGKILGVGGFRFTPDGVVAAFALLTEEGRAHRVTLHRAGRRMMASARRQGIRRIVALAEPGRPRAAPWLARFGFKPVDVDGEIVWLWQNEVARRHA